jgi:hypothetical protein
MDTSSRSPLFEMFARGEVPVEMRLVAARGAFTLAAQEQLALLILLVHDTDSRVAETARETLDRLPHKALAAFLARPDTPAELREFFRARGIEVADAPAAQADEPLLASEPDDTPADEDADREATAARLAKLPVAERIKRAMLGSREERFILIRDNNRLVAGAVLTSPKINDSDIESFAKMVNVAEDVLRVIGNARGWVKKYPIAAALALNPKTPLSVSIGLVPRLVERDVKAIMRDRNMPEPLRAVARRVMANQDARR